MASILALLAVLPACQPNGRHQATLAPTLNLRGAGVPIAYENGMPIPSFGFQPRPSIDLNGGWRFQPAPLDSNLTLGDRRHTLGAIQREADGRQQAHYDDRSWSPVEVPSTFDRPPTQHGGGAWYRRVFEVPERWGGLTATLKFASANYVADVWLNGTYLGYHEGGSTPFAFDVSKALVPGTSNTLAVRVDNPPWGTRNDILPWGLADWWNYGGLTGPVWLEGSDPLHVVRADVVPHLDGADVQVLLQNSASEARHPTLTLELLPTAITPRNLLDPNPTALVAAGAQPVATHTVDLGQIGGDSVSREAYSFLLRGVDLWQPGQPALYVLHVALKEQGSLVDESYESFGLRQIRVDSTFPRLLLNGQRIAFRGVAAHDERQTPTTNGQPAGGLMATPEEFLGQLLRAQAVHADLIRADHHPPNAWLPLLADRLGIAVWEEIPFYHYTPETFSTLMGRGIPQQMLVEMALRDFNRPSVLFHGLANESTGGPERQSALAELRDLDRKVDGTRLVGQAAYGSDPTDPTSDPLDVAGFTFYWGVFYGGQLSPQEVAQQLARAHRAYPHKPIMILEFGHWADSQQEEAVQTQTFDLTYQGLAPWLDDVPGGYVGSVVWWSLDDYWTQRPGISVEHFGLFRPDGLPRPAADQVSRAYALASPQPKPPPVTGGEGHAARLPGQPARLLRNAAFAILLPAVTLLLGIVLLSWLPRRRPLPRRRTG
jgi:beta-galactosidase